MQGYECSYWYVGRTCNIEQLQFFNSLPSGYECHTSIITVLITSQCGKDPSLWQADVVSTSGLRDIQNSRTDPSLCKSHENADFCDLAPIAVVLRWPVLRALLVSASTSNGHFVSCVSPKTEATTWMWGQSEGLDQILGSPQPLCCPWLSTATVNAAWERVFPSLPSLANLG